MLLVYLIVLNMVLVTLAVLIHYETLFQLNKRLSCSTVLPRFRVLIGVFAIIIAHILEIWLFALGYYALVHIDGMGSLTGNIGLSLLEYSYFSFVTFTTLGYGDVIAQGYLRYLAGLEALTGFVMLTWSASFLFLEMQRYWAYLPRPLQRNDTNDEQN